MSKKTVKTTFDVTNPPPLSEKQRAEVAALQAMPDSGVDTSDIAELTPAFWQNAVRKFRCFALAQVPRQRLPDAPEHDPA